MNGDARYPIGSFQPVEELSPDERVREIDFLAAAPGLTRDAVEGLTGDQLDTAYREGGWTARQVVHHLADSHTNAHLRMRLVLTEDVPTLMGYKQPLWAELADARSGPVETSLTILDGVHARMVALLRSLDSADFERRFVHADGYDGTLDKLVQLYSWHGRHHTAHITGLRERNGW